MFASKDLFFTKPSGAYKISRSVRLRSSASAYFNRTPAGAGNRQVMTFSWWMKRGDLSTTPRIFSASNQTTDDFTIDFSGSGSLEIYGYVSTVVQLQLVTTAVYRDSSAWYHVVVAIDSTQATNTNRTKLYVNGVQITAFSTATYPAQNTSFYWNTATDSRIGIYQNGTSSKFDGYLTEINVIDGQALTPSSFGSTNAVTGVWQPKSYTGTYGTNGFYLNFSDNSSNTATTIGKDYSGNSNNWTPNNISVTAGATYDSMLDVPTLYADGGNGRGNYCVMNPLTSQGNTVSDGNLKVTLAASLAAGYGTRGSIAISSGNKFYWEISPTTTSSVYTVIGIIDAAYKFGTDIATAGSNCVLYYKSSGNKIVNGTTTSYGTTYAANDVIGVAVDYSANTCTFYLNNVSQGAISLPSTSIDYIPVVGNENLVADVFQANFGQRPFTYTPPTGFSALNTQNLPTPTISNGATVMAATLWTGTGAAQTISNTVNGVSFKPDFVWAKSRSAAESHRLEDSVRGATLALYSNLTNAEATEAQSITAFGSTGFTLGTGTPNTNAATYVGWQWQAGQGSTSSNTSGSITSTTSVNATAGFSVVTWAGNSTSGATIGHGLGVAPSLLITKSRTNASSWIVGIGNLSGFGVNDYLVLQTTDAVSSTSTFYQAYGSSTFTVGVSAANEMNKTGNNYVTYAFSAVAGYSAFGKYTGNGSTDGPFVYLGFRPRFILFKSASGAYDWIIWDTSRATYNVVGPALNPNLSDAEATPALNQIDILSNGFKIRNTGVATNTNGATIIYAAFCENPFKLSLAR